MAAEFRCEPDFSNCIAPVPRARHLKRHRASPSQDLSFRQVTVANELGTTILCLVGCIGLRQNCKFGFNGLLNQTLRAGS